MNWTKEEIANAQATVASWSPEKREEFKKFFVIINHCSNLITEYCDTVDADTVRVIVSEMLFKVGDAFMDDFVKNNINSICGDILLKYCKNFDKSVLPGIIEKIIKKLNAFYVVGVGCELDKKL